MSTTAVQGFSAEFYMHFHHRVKCLLLMLVQHLSSSPQLLPKSPEILKGDFIKPFCPALNEHSFIAASMFLCIFLRITHDNKRRKRCCVIFSPVLHLTSLHISTELDLQAPAVIFPLLFSLLSCTITIVYLHILGILLKLLIYL